MEDESLPEVGGGRGSTRLPETTLQPISFHALPRMVMDSLSFAYWAQTCMDMTPGFGELCCDMVLQKIGYVGLCQSEQQRQFIEEKAIKDFFLPRGFGGQKNTETARQKNKKIEKGHLGVDEER